MSRIIAGSAKGRRLNTPKGSNTRPTTDRTREALFSALVSWFDTSGLDAEQQLADVAVLDLFAGTGGVGLEAASRGAGPVVLVEADRPTARLIESNVEALRLSASVRCTKAEAYLAGTGAPFDLVFLDPPYAVPTLVVDALLVVVAERFLARRGLIVVERSARDTPPEWPAGIAEHWAKQYGETTLFFGAAS